MTEPIDTGFDDVIAGEQWVDPAPAEPVTATVSPPETPPSPAGEDHLDAAIEKALAPVPVDDALVQATKALVKLPVIDVPTLAKLARDVAMDIKERHAILRDYNLDQAQYDYLETYNDFYKNALSAASIEWHAPLSTTERIKIEAAAILEDSLPGLGARMQNKSEGLPGVIEAAKLFAKIAGAGEQAGSGAGSGERFTINIDLGGDQKIAVSTGGPSIQSAQRTLDGSLSADVQAANSFLTISEKPEG